ncbi:MAG: hypothetical protein FWE65_02390 [Eggerthellaceae bacterium]|nr:hypothetical protein [Eggerthellaceae bacterium]
MRTSKLSKRGKLMSLLSLVLVGALSFCLVSCGKSDVKVIRNALNDELELIKKLDQPALEAMLGTAINNADLKAYGIDRVEFNKAWMGGFDYSVDKVEIDGDSAKASITITCKKLADIKARFDISFKAFATGNEVARMPEAEVTAKTRSLMMEAIAGTSTTTTNITLTYVKVDNTWRPGPGTDAELLRAFVGNMQ